MTGDSYKSCRILKLYKQFWLSKVINKRKATDYFGVNISVTLPAKMDMKSREKVE